jgi:transcriptional regulator with XRE-family HTH domain
MGAKVRRIDIGAARGRASTATILTELRDARIERGLSGMAVARAVGVSAAQFSRIERGLAGPLTIERASMMLAAVGLELAVRVYPGGEPLRDAAHVALLHRLRVRLHPSLRFRTEVPFPAANDFRAWDAVISGPGWRYGVEAETRPTDRQALERRLALKLRDGDVHSMSLLLLNSRHNRDFVRAHRNVLSERFPMPSGRALELLGAGVDPGLSAIILL